MSRARRIVAKAGLACASLAVAWTILEIAVRAVGLGQPRIPPAPPGHLPWIAYHPRVGWINRPGFQGRQKTGLIDVGVTIDRHGGRSASHAATAETGARRVLVLGDSFTFGHGVEDVQTYAALLEARLPGTEVVNAAVVGTGHDQQLLWFQEEGVRLKPELLIWGFSSADIPRNTLYFWRLLDPQTGLDFGKPRFVMRGDALVLTHVPTPDPARMDDAIRTWMAAREAGRCAIARGLRRSALVRLLWDHAEAAAEKVEQVRLTRRLAFRMVEASREAGVPLLIANLPVERWLRSRSPVVWLKRHLTDRILRDLAAEAGVPVVDVWPDFRAAGKGDGLFIADGHYSPAGHAVVADALERALARLRQ